MKAEKQHKESSSSKVRSKQKSGKLIIVDNRPESIFQAKLIDSMASNTRIKQCMYDPDWVLPGDDAPSGYEDIAQTAYDTNHHDLDGKVKVCLRSGKAPFLWWQPPYRYEIVRDFKLTGTRSTDKTALRGDGGGKTWHHCGDWVASGGSFGKCTMLLVPTNEHESFGHTGGVDQYEAATGKDYG